MSPLYIQHLNNVQLIIWSASSETEEFIRKRLRARNDLYVGRHMRLWRISQANPGLLLHDFFINESRSRMKPLNSLGPALRERGISDELVHMTPAIYLSIESWFASVLPYFQVPLAQINRSVPPW